MSTKPTTVTVYLSKGGVCKSTIAQILGLFLAGLGFRVVILDLDRQGGQSSIFDLLDETGRGAEALDLVLKRELDILAALTPVPDEAIPRFKGFSSGTLSVVQGGPNTQIAIDEVLSQPTKYHTRTSTLIARPIDEMAGYVDFAILDMGPSDQLTALAGLEATDWLLVPTTADRLSVERIAAVEDEVAVARETNPGLRYLGIVQTMTRYYFGGLRTSRNVKYGRDLLETVYDDRLLKDRKGEAVELPYDEGWPAARWAGTSVLMGPPTSTARADALRFVRAVAYRLGLGELYELDPERIEYA